MAGSGRITGSGLTAGSGLAAGSGFAATSGFAAGGAYGVKSSGPWSGTDGGGTGFTMPARMSSGSTTPPDAPDAADGLPSSRSGASGSFADEGLRPNSSSMLG